MRALHALALTFAVAVVAPEAAAAAQKKAAAAPKPNPVAASYAAMPANERIAIQSDLVWTGDFNGIASADFGERAIAAVKAFQKRNGGKETGVLNQPERAALAAAAKVKHEAAGWRIVDDPVGGMRLGVPGKLVPQTSAGRSGTRWTSARGETQVETFRETGALAAVFERQKKEPGDRKVTYSLLRPDFFVVAGLQGLKKFYVRAQAQNGDVRGVTILYDQAMEGIVDPIVVAMSSAFTPFPATAAGAAPRRRVEYGTGVAVSAAGHVLTDRQLTEGCNVITLPGIGGADRVAEDRPSEIALLRVYGASVKPLALAEAASAGEVTLAGIADPQMQAGGNAVSVQRARVNGAIVEPAPGLGFTGAAALDAQGRLTGLVRLMTPVVAGPAPAPGAALVPASALRAFLAAQGVALAAAAGGIDAARAGLVRVICVRK